uniref:CUB domain-containing protein n=1 Tax=Strigamia maritima TaxID=126957 RepID=T1JCM0_STRMM
MVTQEDTYFSFDSKVEQQFELYARYGPNPILYPDRRGKLVSGTFCDRIFHDCRLGTCYVQSPGYPGIYPRDLRCRYFLHTQSVYINPYLENEVLSIDGQQCADMIVCPLRPITNNCPGDYLRIYDGWTEDSPVIGTFCGSGRFPYAITGSGNRLLVMFVSTRAGPMLNTGFHFNVGPNPKWVGPGAAKINGSCSSIFDSRDDLSEHERRFYSLATWYTPNTNCDFLIRAESEQIIRLYFKSFRVHRPKHAIAAAYDCAESLAVYDSDVPDEKKVLAIFCDTWGAVVEESAEFVSSGSNMLVQFKSTIGSYAGSSLDFWVQFDFYDSYQHGEPVANTLCDEIFRSSKSWTGAFGSPLNPLVLRHRSSLNCHYAFRADSFLSERVLVIFSSLHFTNGNRTCEVCLTDQVDKMVIQESSRDSTGSICLCNSSLFDPLSLTFTSMGPDLDLSFYYQMNSSDSDKSERKIQAFRGTYEFFHGSECGPGLVEISNQGELEYPSSISMGNADEPDISRANVRCIWTVPVTPHMDVYMWFVYLTMPSNCSADRIDVRLPPSGWHYTSDALFTVCGDEPMVDLPLIDSSSIAANKFLVELRTSVESDTRFKLVITQVVRQSEREFFFKLGVTAPCSFLCPGSNVCISQDLVCNGVRNCPLNGYLSTDEDATLCGAHPLGMNWLVLAVGGGGGFLLTVCLMVVAKKCAKAAMVKRSRAAHY